MPNGHPMVRRRTGTGTLYADNAPRRESPALRRGWRRSKAVRGSNTVRPWASTDGDPIEFDFEALLRQAQGELTEILEMFSWVGEVVTHCLRRRERLDADTRADAAGWLEWYIVLHAVGLIDRHGAWLGPDLREAAI